MPLAADNKPPCEKCANTNTAVVDSRVAEFNGVMSVRRRRKCKACGARWGTYEISGAELARFFAATPIPPQLALANDMEIFIAIAA